jgi:hypothetical protein
LWRGWSRVGLETGNIRVPVAGLPLLLQISHKVYVAWVTGGVALILQQGTLPCELMFAIAWLMHSSSTSFILADGALSLGRFVCLCCRWLAVMFACVIVCSFFCTLRLCLMSCLHWLVFSSAWWESVPTGRLYFLCLFLSAHMIC